MSYQNGYAGRAHAARAKESSLKIFLALTTEFLITALASGVVATSLAHIQMQHRRSLM